MQFILIDVAATLAVLVGYRAFLAFERRRSQLITLSRRARRRDARVA
ncbi:MAG TPA: hypothetical protein VID49_04285 [Steroidobacteraceae bacterium]|jgi:hypothetical protein